MISRQKKGKIGAVMKAAIIGASGESLYTIKKAQAYGLTAAALDGNPKAAGLLAADEPVVADISDEENTIRVLKRIKPDFVLTVPIGRYLTTIGAVNDALGLPGISRKMAAVCTDKFLFHKRLHDKGLRDARCYGIMGWEAEDSHGRVYQGEKEICDVMPLTFPAILKPRYGSGSRGIHMLADRQHMLAALREVSGEPYVLEECVEGEEYGVDGAVIGGRFTMILLRRKENTPPPARQAVGYFSVPPDNEVWQQVCGHMEKAVKCLEINECLLHADVIRSAKGPFVIELSARPSGHNLHNLFTPLCTGIDPAEEYIRYRLGLSYRFTPAEVKPMLIHYFDMQGKVASVPHKEDVERMTGADVAAWECHIKEGEELGPVSDGHSLMGRGFFVLAGDSNAELLKQTEEIKDLFME
ncbi:MAG: ATP-grasp domain-containing protein [Lachnospiraceae bacterium]|nr:ATP-grasp domain-containing protein [Lachnospiraceae bacterium]